MNIEERKNGFKNELKALLEKYDAEISIEDVSTVGQHFRSDVDAVVALTKKKGEDYFDYLKRVKENYLAVDVKLADLKDNMNLTRLKEL